MKKMFRLVIYLAIYLSVSFWRTGNAGGQEINKSKSSGTQSTDKEPEQYTIWGEEKKIVLHTHANKKAEEMLKAWSELREAFKGRVDIEGITQSEAALSLFSELTLAEEVIRKKLVKIKREIYADPIEAEKLKVLSYESNAKADLSEEKLLTEEIKEENKEKDLERLRALARTAETIKIDLLKDLKDKRLDANVKQLLKEEEESQKEWSSLKKAP